MSRETESTGYRDFNSYSAKVKDAAQLGLDAFKEVGRLSAAMSGRRDDPMWRDEWMAAMAQLRLAGGAFLSLRGPYGFEAVDEGFHDAGRELEAAAADGEVAITSNDNEAGLRAGRRIEAVSRSMVALQTRLIAATVNQYGVRNDTASR